MYALRQFIRGRVAEGAHVWSTLQDVSETDTIFVVCAKCDYPNSRTQLYCVRTQSENIVAAAAQGLVHLVMAPGKRQSSPSSSRPSPADDGPNHHRHTAGGRRGES